MLLEHLKKYGFVGWWNILNEPAKFKLSDETAGFGKVVAMSVGLELEMEMGFWGFSWHDPIYTIHQVAKNLEAMI